MPEREAQPSPAESWGWCSGEVAVAQGSERKMKKRSRITSELVVVQSPSVLPVY